MDAFKIAFKDLRILVRDRRALVVLLILPMVLIAVIGSSTGRLMDDDASAERLIRVHLLDYSRSAPSTRLAGFLAVLPGLEVHAGNVDDPGGTERPHIAALPPGNFDVEVVIGPEFSGAAEDSLRSDLLASDVGDGSILPELDLRVSVSAAANPMLAGYVRLALLRAAEQALVLTVPVPELGPPTTAPAIDAGRVYRFVVPAFTVLFVFFLVTIMGRSFILERELGTLRRLRIAPISSESILMGKTLPFLGLSVVQTVILLTAGRALFGMSWGAQPWLLIPVILATSLAATTLGLAFASWVKTESQVSAWGNLIVLGTAGISGCLVPRRWMPELAQSLSRATPHAWALDAYREILVSEVPLWTTVVVCCLVLLGFATLFFAVGFVGFRRQSE